MYRIYRLLPPFAITVLKSSPLIVGNRSVMNRDQLLAHWLEEEQQPFVGWDFSYLDGRMTQDSHPWSYVERATSLIQSAEAVLDLDTGGGERLLDLQSHWPPQVVATEAYPPNVFEAHRQLAPAGGAVVWAESNEINNLPFTAESFDLILNRHGAFKPDELARILRPGGTFLTKQVHGLWAHDLMSLFGAAPQWPDATPERYVPMLEQAGLTMIEVADWRGKLRFTDVGAIVYYLKAVPWLVPEFSVATHQDVLFDLQSRLDSGEELNFFAGTYLIEARI